MAPIIRMPTTDELPDGPRRRFAGELFELFRAANRPTLRVISKAAEREDLPGTASRETIRRMLQGTIVPRWKTVETVFLVLCELAGQDPDAGRWEMQNFDDPPPSYRQALKDAWNDAVDDLPGPPRREPAPDPWADPPF